MENDFILLKRIRDILFFIFCIFLFLFVSLFIYIEANAATITPSSVPYEIFANNINGTSQQEQFNKIIYNNFYYPTDAGNISVFFNYDCDLIDPVFGICPSHYYGASSIVWHYLDSLDGNYEINYSFRVRNYSTETNTFRNYNFIISDFLYQNQERIAAWHNIDGSSYYTPIFVGFERLDDTTAIFKYKLQVRRFSDIYFSINPWGSSRYSAYSIGFKIDSINSWSGSITSGDLNKTTQDIIQNNNSNTEIIKTEIGGIPGKIINGLASFFQSIVNAIGNISTSIWNLFSAAFTTLFGWLSDIFDGIQDIISDETPTNEWLSNFMQNLPYVEDNFVFQFITLPIHLIQSFISASNSQCVNISFGSLYGTNLGVSCVGPVLKNYFGPIYNIIGWIITAMISWRLLGFYYIFTERLLSLEPDLNEKFNIDL